MSRRQTEPAFGCLVVSVLLTASTTALPAASLSTRDYLNRLGQILATKTETIQDVKACATSDVLERYLEGRYRAQSRLATISGREAGSSFSEDGGIENRDGIWIVEGDDTILALDNPSDLEGKSVRFSPSGNGYDVTVEPLQYDSDIGSSVLSGATSRTYVPVALSGAGFPLGGIVHTTLWVGSDFGVRTDDGMAASPFTGNQYSTTAACADLFLDAADRIAPLQYARGSSWGRYVYVRVEPGQLVVTWRSASSPEGQTFYADVQAILHSSGEIVFSYRTLQNIDNGAPLVYANIPDWLLGFTDEGSISDPVDPVDPPLDLRELRLYEDPATDLIRLSVTLEDSIPDSYPDWIEYTVTLKQAGNPLYQFWAAPGQSLWLYEIATDSWVIHGEPVFDDDTWEIPFSLADLPELTAGAVVLEAASALNGAGQDDATLPAAISGGTRFAHDYTADAPFSSSTPIVETFLYPEFVPAAVKHKLLAETGWDETLIDGLPMYQTFFSSIIFFAGAYSAEGNCGAANMGMCDPSSPLQPSVLHMNKTDYSWNRTTNGSIHVLSHEFGHHWLERIDIDEGGGSTDVLNPASAHPAAYVHTEALQDLVHPEDSSVMGGGYWADNGDGTFTTPADWTYYSFAGYELYLMGLMDPSEVPGWSYLANTDPPQPLAYYPSPNVTVTADYHGVTIQMVLDAMGLRDPLYPDAKQHFFAPLILVVRPGDEPTTEEWDFMMSLRDPWRAAFHTQTYDRGVVTTISPREVSAPGTGSLRVVREGADLRLVFENPEFGDQVSYNVYEGQLGGAFDDWDPLTCGSDPVDLGGGKQYLDVTPSQPAEDTYYLVTMSNVAVEAGAGADSTGAKRSTVAQRCGGQP